jgi:hypothetical protein
VSRAYRLTFSAMVLWRSFRKSVKIHSISKRLAVMPPTSEGPEALVAWTEARAAAKTELFNLCTNDPALRHVMKQHGASRETLDTAYLALLREGALAWKQGHLVAASALCFGQTLDFVLRNYTALTSGQGSAAVVSRLLLYFENKESGRISLSDSSNR